jgi:hypothetical protein
MREIRAFVRPVLAAAASVLALAAAPVAGADAVYHSEHIELTTVGAASGGGFVENIHANGATVYAHEIYVLVGATPNASYEVHVLVFPFDPTCSSTPIDLGSTTVTTNVHGNGNADRFFSQPPPPPFRNATHGVRWTVMLGATLAYETDCTAVTLD